MNHKYLFAFENDKSCIVEVKKTDMPKDTPLGEIYFWIMIDKVLSECSKLDFVSMQKEPTQIREFKTGILKFTDETALFENFNEGFTIRYNKISLEEINKSIKEIVSKFI